MNISKFAQEQVIKCQSRLNTGDFDGAISSARSLVEATFGEVHLEITGENLPKVGDLAADYKKIKKLVEFADGSGSEEVIKGLTHGLSGVVASLELLSNQMGDRHRPISRPKKIHAQLAVSSAIAITDFFNGLMIQRHEQISSDLLIKLLSILNTERRNFSKDLLLKDPAIAEQLKTVTPYLLRSVKEKFWQTFKVTSFRQSDIFFAFMRIVFDVLDTSDIIGIFIEKQDNDQLVGYEAFEADLKKDNPKLLDRAMEEMFAQ